ncbi:Hypothetical protein D9617_10g072850 [Elsinoe fawcettii]|nr:Hypothetical protein D9617_10g072850 [Elsinoe fawcettii]
MARLTSASPAPIDVAATAPGAVNATRRSTRSQSREPQAMSQPVTGNTRGGSRQADPARQDAAEGLSSMARGALGLNNGLPSVTEEAEQPLQASFAPLNDGPNGRQSQHGRFSTGAASMFSTTFSQEEVADLDPDAILGSLPDLDSMAEGILNTAAPEQAGFEALKENALRLNDNASSSRKYLLGRVRTFGRMQGDFGRQTFIDPEHILRALLDLEAHSELPNTPYRPDDVLYKANLVSFLQIIFDSRTPEKVFETMNSLDSQFPMALLAALRSETEYQGLVGESQLVDATRSLALEIRIQFFIHALIQGEIDEPLETTLARVFLFELDDDTYGIPAELNVDSIRPFNDAMHANDAHSFYTSVIEHIDGLRRLMDSCHDNVELAITRLREENSWEDFCTRVLSWVQLRHQELDRMIDERGGVESIVDQLRKEVESVQNQNDPALDPAIGGPGSSRPSLATNDNIAILRQRRQQQLKGIRADIDAMTSEGIADLQNYNSAGNDILMDDNQAESVQPQSRSSVDAAMRNRLLALQANNAGQENRRFIDRQANARRIAFDDTQQSQGLQDSVPNSSYPGTYPGTSPVARRRRHDEIESPEPSQDQAFQMDSRVHAAPQRAPAANMIPSSALTNRNVRPRTSNMDDVTQGNIRIPEVQRTNPGQAVPPYNTDRTHYSGADLLEHATQLARLNAPARNKPRARTPWSREENDALIELVAELGTGWSEIKKVDASRGNVMKDRSPEDIRFRARNVKVTILQGPGLDALPPGFEDVPLGKKEIDKLPDHIKAVYVQQRQRTSRRREDEDE